MPTDEAIPEPMRQFSYVRSIANRGKRTKELLEDYKAALLTLHVMLSDGYDAVYKAKAAEIDKDFQNIDMLEDGDYKFNQSYRECYKWFGYISALFNRKGMMMLPIRQNQIDSVSDSTVAPYNTPLGQPMDSLDGDDEE